MTTYIEKIKSARREDITFVVSATGDAAGVYIKGELVKTGHADDVAEALINAFFRLEYVPNLVIKEGPGWSGIAKTLKEAGVDD